jgi:hypothetical protein
MEPILAEPVPYRRRAVFFTVALSVVALLALAGSGHSRSKHRWHQPARAHHKCPHAVTVYLVR